MTLSPVGESVAQVTASVARLRSLCRRSGLPVPHVPTYELIERANSVPADVIEGSSYQVAHFLCYGVRESEREQWRRQNVKRTRASIRARRKVA